MKLKLSLSTLAVLSLSAAALAQEAVEAGAHGGHEAGEAAASPFAGTIYQSVAAVIVFLILLAVLRWKAWGPILKGLQDRENKIKGDLQHAEEAARKATKTLEEYHARLAAAQNESRQIIEQGRADALKLGTQLKESAQSEITALRQRAEADIRAAKEQALSEIYAQTATLATDVAGKILRRQITPQDQQQLVQDSLAELARTSRS